MLRIQHLLDSLLTDGGGLSASHTGRAPLPEIFIICLWYSFMLRDRVKPLGVVMPGGFGDFIEFNYLNGSRTRDLRACIIVPQQVRYARATVVAHSDVSLTEKFRAVGTRSCDSSHSVRQHRSDCTLELPHSQHHLRQLDGNLSRSQAVTAITLQIAPTDGQAAPSGLVSGS
jgi:hypothetical protein